MPSLAGKDRVPLAAAQAAWGCCRATSCSRIHDSILNAIKAVAALHCPKVMINHASGIQESRPVPVSKEKVGTPVPSERVETSFNQTSFIVMEQDSHHVVLQYA
jgi:hypothetical protein